MAVFQDVQATVLIAQHFQNLHQSSRRIGVDSHTAQKCLQNFGVPVYHNASIAEWLENTSIKFPDPGGSNPVVRVGRI